MIHILSYSEMPRVFIIKKTLEYRKKQSKVLKLILKNPGVRYRQLLRATGLSNGSLSNILRKLENSRSIIVNRTANNRVTAYYPKNINTAELHIIENLRNNIDRRIIQYLLEQDQGNFYDIVNHSKRAPSTISWHLNRLKNGRLLTSTSRNGKPNTYKIINKNSVARILSKRLDTLV
jgi:predicted transcriptional regulator